MAEVSRLDNGEIQQVQGDNRLPVLAAEIRNYHEAAREAFGSAPEYVTKAGEALIEAKKLVRHGDWLPWLRDNCQMSKRTAQLYMQIARRKEELKYATVALFRISTRDDGLRMQPVR